MEQRGIPLHFVQLPPEKVQEALDGHEDILAGEQLKAEALYRQHLNCHNGCGQTMEKCFSTVAFAFSDKNWHIPRCVMKCYACEFTLNPFDGMVVNIGNKDKAKYGNVPIINQNGG